MSADRWTQCPRCHEAHGNRLNEMKANLDAAYGVLPLEEFDLARATYEQLRDEKQEPTMREDWELGMENHGEFSVNYRCSCDTCGFAFSYVKTEMVPADLLKSVPTTKYRKCRKVNLDE